MQWYYPSLPAGVEKSEMEQSPMSEPVLFFDYDGVLHPDAVYHTSQGIVLHRDGVRLFEWTPLLGVALAPYPEVRIVLSTSRLRVLDVTYSRKRLPPGLQGRVIGATWHSQMVTALLAYNYWFAKDAPTGVDMPGRGYPKPPQPLGSGRGSKVYQANCAICHGDKGRGTKVAEGTPFHHCGTQTPTTGVPACTEFQLSPPSSRQHATRPRW